VLPEEAVREVLTAAAQRDGSVQRELVPRGLFDVDLTDVRGE
jgi:hypothetical protein